MISELKKDGESLQQLISNIQPIKKETAEDVLRDILDTFANGGDLLKNIGRAKDVLGE